MSSNENDGSISDSTSDNRINNSVILDSREIDSAELDTMKGDTIGDTVYSGKWIISTVMSLSKVPEVGWTEELEADLCILWDTTTEKDIVLYLLENDFLKIAEFILKVSTKPRLTEIVVGIVGNMCCQSTVLETVGSNKEFTEIIFNLLSCDDPETLIQILRLLQAAMWDIQRNVESAWLDNLEQCEFFGDVLVFILKSSTNDDLLMATIDLLCTMSGVKSSGDSNMLVNVFNINELIPALLESFIQIIPKDENIHSQTHLKVIENWLTILSGLTKLNLLKFDDCKKNENLLKMTDIFIQILTPYTKSYNLIPIQEEVALCIHECIEIILWLECNAMYLAPDVNYIIVIILFKLRAGIQEHVSSHPDDVMNELFKYLERYVLRIFQVLTNDEIERILDRFDIETLKNVTVLLKEHSKTSLDCFKKLIEARSCLEST